MEPVSPPRISTGIAGLDNLLAGGLPRRGLYLLEGAPGTGKTTFALQFLLAGVTFSETAGEVREFAETHGWSLDGVEIMDLNDLRAVVGDTSRQTVFHHAEVEFTKLTNLIAQCIEKTKAVGSQLIARPSFGTLGLDRGTSTMFMGPAGSGKSILAARVALAAAERSEKATVYAFEESLGTLTNHSAGICRRSWRVDTWLFALSILWS